MKNTKRFASLAGKLNIGVIVFMVVTGISILVSIILPLISVVKPDFFLDDKGMVSGMFEIGELRIKLSNAPISFTSIQNFPLFNRSFQCVKHGSCSLYGKTDF